MRIGHGKLDAHHTQSKEIKNGIVASPTPVPSTGCEMWLLGLGYGPPPFFFSSPLTAPKGLPIKGIRGKKMSPQILLSSRLGGRCCG